MKISRRNGTLMILSALIFGISNQAYASTLASYSTSDGDLERCGHTHQYDECAQSFTPSADENLDTISVSAANFFGQSPSGHMTIGLYTDSGGEPGTLIEQGSNITNPGTNTFADLTSTFSGSTALSTGTTYWVVMGQTVAEAQGYMWDGGHTSVPYADAKKYDGAVWTAETGINFLFDVEGSVGGGGGGGGTGTTTSSALPLTADDELFMFGVALFFLSLLGWGVIFRPFQNL